MAWSVNRRNWLYNNHAGCKLKQVCTTMLNALKSGITVPAFPDIAEWVYAAEPVHP